MKLYYMSLGEILINKQKITIFLRWTVLALIFFGSSVSNSSDRAFSDIITLISIAIGFFITSLSILSKSPQIIKANKEYKTKGNSPSLFESLIVKFKEAIFYFILTLCIILLYKYIEPNTTIISIYIYKIDLLAKLAGIIWCLTIISIMTFVVLINFLLNFIAQIKEI